MIKVKRKNMKLQNISIAIPVGKESTVITYLIIIFVNLWKSRSQLKTSCRCKLQIQLNNLSRVLYKRVANHFTHINQIRFVAFNVPQLTQASLLQKTQTLQNVFLISVTMRWHRASLVCNNHSFKKKFM
jgi:hypothetical protein